MAGSSITGAQCQYARSKLGLTQAQVASAVGVSRSQIANFETKGERFTPSEAVRTKLRAYFEAEDPDFAQDAAALGGAAANDEDAATPDQRLTGSAVPSNAMRYVRRLTEAGCFRMSADLTEAQRDRLLAQIDKVRERLDDIAQAKAQPGFFDPYDQATDDRIAEADGLIKEFGFLCIVAFGYGFITLPTPSLLDGKRKPATIADALGLKYADQFKKIGIRKNDTSSTDEPDVTAAA